ncbi:MAG TPA: lipopolysaccharide biosynthesis protein [Candidatus Acidoferrales bacterium]|nr:lipopolysaccharide biosynthesis protein [Candidatus Acidoferrales bacterium]
MVGATVTVARGAAAVYLANVVALVASTFSFLILTNILRSTAEVGVVIALNLMVWLLTAVSMTAQPVTQQSPIPAPPAVLKLIPELLSRNAHSSARRIFHVSIISSAVIAGVIAGILITSPSIVIPLLGGSSVVPMFVQLAAVDVIVLSLGQVSLASLMSAGDVRRASGYMAVWSLLRNGIASLLLLKFAISGVLVGWVVGDSLLLIIALRRSNSDFLPGAVEAGSILPDFLRSSSYTLLSALLGYAVTQADKLFTLAEQGLSSLAIYNVAIVAANVPAIAPYALTMVLLPALSSLHAEGEILGMKQIVRRYSRYVSLIVIPLAVEFAAVTRVALRIFGPAYLNGLVPSVIVSLMSGFTSVGAVYAAVLLAVGRLRWYMAANLLGVMALAIVAYIVSPYAGLAGPALGRAGLMIVTALLYAYASRKSGFFEFDARAFLSSALSSLPAGAVVYILLSSIHSFAAQLAALPEVVILGILVYVGALRVLRTPTAADFEFIRQMAPPRTHRLMVLIARLAGVRMDNV